MNRDFKAREQEDSQIEGVIQSYELAFRMQSALPEVRAWGETIHP